MQRTRRTFMKDGTTLTAAMVAMASGASTEGDAHAEDADADAG
ncbi:twin-arginine translocation signal domain-containing protein, partial [Singulisphaera rosea]